MITLTREAWKRFAPNCPDEYTNALFAHISELDSAGIFDTELRWCHWAATVYHETGRFEEIRENLRYTSCSALRTAWPSRFGHATDEDLKPLLKNPKALGERVYGIESGRKPDDLGNTLPGDGYAFRGGGWFNTTGRGPVEAYCAKIGLPVPARPSVLDDPVATLKFAILEWMETKCNEWADENDITKVAKAINTGSANSGVRPIGMEGRKKAFARAWKIWGETGEADAPVLPGEIAEQVKKAAVKYGGPVVAVAGGGAHVATKASQEAPTQPPKLDATKGLAKAQETRQTVTQAKEEASAWVGLASEAKALVGLPGLFLCVSIVAVYFGIRWIKK